MTELRANTEIMKKGAQTLGSIQAELSALNGEIRTLVNFRDHQYNGQLAQKVGELMAGTTAQGAKVETLTGELSSKLSKKALEIEWVNSATFDSVQGLSHDFASLSASPQAQASAQLRNLNLQEIGFFWKLLGLFGISFFFNKSTSIGINNNAIPITNTSPTPQTNTAEKGFYAIKPVTVTMQDGSSKQFPAGTFFIKGGNKYYVMVEGEKMDVKLFPKTDV